MDKIIKIRRDEASIIGNNIIMAKEREVFFIVGDEFGGWEMVNSDKSISMRQVRMGRRLNGQVQILAGLRKGDRVFNNPLEAVAQLKAKPSR